MILRPLRTAAECARVLPLLVRDAAGGLTAEVYASRLAAGQYRPGWTWVAEEAPGAVPSAVAVWWSGGPGDERPAALDGVATGPAVPGEARSTLAAALLAAAHRSFGPGELPGWHLFVPADWHERPDAVAAVAWRREAARRAGLTEYLERLRYEWTAAAGTPPAPGRLNFAAEPDDEVFAGLFRRVLADTLDATSRRAAGRIGPAAQAAQDLALYRDTMLGERSWWRVARDPAGEVVGFGIPSRNHHTPVVGYLGVLPGHRGRGYADEILADITRTLAALPGTERIRADTDLANTPMAACFERTGYRNWGRRLVFSAA